MRPLHLVTAAAVALVVAGAAFADGSKRSEKGSTISLIQTPVSSKFVPVGTAKGPTAGDLLLLHALLHSPASNKVVGHASGYCVLIVPAQQTYQCQIINTLNGGTLVGAGPFTPGKPGVSAVAGTGAYAGVSGQVTITPKGTNGDLSLVFQI